MGKAYTKAMGLKTGDEFEIKLGYKNIRLVHLNGDRAEPSEEVE